MKESKRQKQFSSLIRKELSEIFLKDARWMFDNKVLITITDVSVSADLRIAKIYLSFMLSKNQQELVDQISVRKGEIRRLLGNRIGKVVRTIPDLIFFLDDRADYAARMDEIISGLDIPPDDEEKSNE